MANITNNNKLNDVRLHIDKAFVIIDEYLPSPYVERVIKKFAKDPPSKSIIRNVRSRLNDRIEVINALVEVALENKAAIEELKLKTA